ncbi:MAG TPA: hypothetical protein DDW16_01940, partial [Clostridiales bacterium]|nr:hypothetical protein [Clostridiales bacterium]
VLIDKSGNITDCLDCFKEEKDYYDYYDKLRSGIIAKTSILSEEAHYNLFKNMVEKGIKTILHVCQSYGLSPTLDRAKDAYKRISEAYPDVKIYFVESSSTTVGEQMLVRKAIEMRDSGCSVEETQQKLESLKMHLQHYLIVSDLMFLKRGGRISGPKAMIGSLLKVRPIIEFNKQGKLDIIRKEMGEKKAFSSVVAEGLEMGKLPDSFQMYIGHTGNKEMAERLCAKVEEAFGYKPEIRLIGPIIGAHLGPDAVAYAFISDKERLY